MPRDEPVTMADLPFERGSSPIAAVAIPAVPTPTAAVAASIDRRDSRRGSSSRFPARGRVSGVLSTRLSIRYRR